MRKIDVPPAFAIVATTLIFLGQMEYAPATARIVEYLGAIGTLALGGFALLQWRESRRTAERQLRAYVVVHSARIENVEVGKMPRAIITFKNSGQTPAYEFSNWSNMGFDLFPPKLEFPMDDGDDPLPSHPLGVSGEIRTLPEFPRPLTAHEIDGLTKGEVALYAIGRARYIDIFGKPHVTQFVLFAGGPIGIGNGQMSSFNTGNIAD